MKTTDDRNYVKIVFPLDKDDDGYPPFDTESMWAYASGEGLFTIDNIPFFAKGISSGDVVAATRSGDEFYFDKIVVPSRNSVIRVVVFNDSDAPLIRESLQQLGAEWEGSNIPSLFSVHIPSDISLDAIRNILWDGFNQKRWEFEEASMRHEEGQARLEPSKD